MKWKKVILVVGGVLGVTVLGLVLAKFRWDARSLRGYDPGPSLEAAAEVSQRNQLFVQYRVRFRSTPTQTVPALLNVPVRGRAPHPCLVFLHGIGQEKEFLNEIAAPFLSNGMAMLMFDQLGRGERKLENAKGLEALTRLRQRCAQTVIDTRRAVDYLESRSDIDRARIVLAGASFGAIVGTDAAAMDSRFRAVWLIYGGGNIPLILQNNELLGTSGFKGKLVGRVGGFLLKPFDPRYHVARISPRPLFMQNGKGDRIIPPECAQQLYDRAGEPKKIQWYDSDHLGDDPEVARQVIGDGITWLKSQL